MAKRAVLTWNSHSKVSPTSGQPMEPLGSGSSHLVSRVKLQRKLHSCRDSADSSSSDSSDSSGSSGSSAEASADSSPNIVPPGVLVHFSASTTRPRLESPRSRFQRENEGEFCSVCGDKRSWNGWKSVPEVAEEAANQRAAGGCYYRRLEQNNDSDQTEPSAPVCTE